MSNETPVPSNSKVPIWIGRVMSAIPVPLLLMSAAMKLMQPEWMVKDFTEKLGYDANVLVGLAIVELTCVILYLVPQTAVLGAILLTGYLGGATATHLRIGEPYIMPVLMGVWLWVALYLRDARLRSLAPWRSL